MLEESEEMGDRFGEGLSFERQDEDRRRTAYFRYQEAIRKKEERVFTDFVMGPGGKMYTLYHNKRTGKPEYEPVEGRH